MTAEINQTPDLNERDSPEIIQPTKSGDGNRRLKLFLVFGVILVLAPIIIAKLNSSFDISLLVAAGLAGVILLFWAVVLSLTGRSVGVFIRDRPQLSWLLVGIFFVFAALGLLFHVEPKPLYQKVLLAGLAELGFAFIIAFIVSQTIDIRTHHHIAERQDEFSKEIQTREKRLSKNIFDYIYSVKLPKSVFEHAEEQIFQQKFYKDNLKVEYEFVEEVNGWILLRCLFEYDLINISNKDRSFDVPFSVDKPMADEADIPNFSVPLDIYKLHIKGKDYTMEEIDKIKDKKKPTNFAHHYATKVDVDTGNSAAVRMGFYVAKRKDDSELWTNLYLAGDTEITIRYPKDKYELYVKAVHGKGDFDRFDQESYGEIAFLKGPLLPRNGIFFWWRAINRANQKTTRKPKLSKN